jgi:phytanoyl-CoA hydroxylase
MVDGNAIRAAKTDFDRDGFAVIRGFYAPREAQDLFEQVERYLARIVPTLPDEAVFYEDKQKPETMMRLERMEKHDPFFDGMRREERYTGLASTLLDDAAVPQQAEVFAKAPRIGKPTPPHQDGNYFMLVPNEALTFWLPIESVDEENGCVRYVRGSHRRGMRHHELSGVFGFSLGITDYGAEDEKLETAVCLESGDVVIHHGMTIHRTDANPTDRLRRAIGLVYYAGRARTDEAAAKQHQAKVFEQWKTDGTL